MQARISDEAQGSGVRHQGHQSRGDKPERATALRLDLASLGLPTRDDVMTGPKQPTIVVRSAEGETAFEGFREVDARERLRSLVEGLNAPPTGVVRTGSDASATSE